MTRTATSRSPSHLDAAARGSGGVTALAIVRALNLVCGAVMLGIPAVLALAVLPALTGRKRADEHLAALLQPLLRILWVAVAVGLLSGLLWLPLQAAAMSGRTVYDAASPAILGAVLWRTHFGNVLLV